MIIFLFIWLLFSPCNLHLDYGIKCKEITPEEYIVPEKEVYAISVNNLDSFEWTRYIKPTARAGYSIFIYDLR